MRPVCPDEGIVFLDPGIEFLELCKGVKCDLGASFKKFREGSIRIDRTIGVDISSEIIVGEAHLIY